MDSKTVLHYAVDEQVKFVDLRFADLLGAWHHITLPISELTPEAFETGFGFDASSLRGWATINESDMLLVPDPMRFWIDPFFGESTLCMIANVIDPITKEGYFMDPRLIARKAEEYLKVSGIADISYFGPEAEFFVFDNVRYKNSPNQSFYKFESSEGNWGSGREDQDNPGFYVRNKSGYVPVPPVDSLQDLRSEIVLNLESMGIKPERHHHEVASGGQCEINFRYSSLMSAADDILIFKYTVRNTAYQYGKAATFMPKPMIGDNGSGMHCHQSLWKNGLPLFAGDKYAGLSEIALHYIGGLLKHAPAIAAFAAPTTNSYKRLVPGFEAPVKLTYSARNRSAAIRIPIVPNAKLRRLEFRPPDPSCNPYLTFAAMLMAGIDGIENKIDPGEPLDKDIYGLSAKELDNIRSLPGSLDEALCALENDKEFLLKGNVFNETLIERHIAHKRKQEVHALRRHPHPLEFQMYFDV